jgi:hypothetical protein
VEVQKKDRERIEDYLVPMMLSGRGGGMATSSLHSLAACLLGFWWGDTRGSEGFL